MESVTANKTNSLDKDLIQNVVQDFARGWNAHESSQFSEVFDEDADFTNVMGISKHGKAAIEALHQPLFKTIWSASILTITETKVRLIRPDVASVDARWVLDGLKDKDENPRPPRNGLLSFIMTSKSGQWKIAVMHNMDLPGSSSQKC